jgi:hypothetical protein
MKNSIHDDNDNEIGNLQVSNLSMKHHNEDEAYQEKISIEEGPVHDCHDNNILKTDNTANDTHNDELEKFCQLGRSRGMFDKQPSNIFDDMNPYVLKAKDDEDNASVRSDEN